MLEKDTVFTLALVTGASSGIGAAMCRLLARRGIPLLITARDLTRLNALGQELEAFVPVKVYAADLSKPKERQGLIEQVALLGPDLVINNAGFGLYGEALSYKTEEQMAILDLNVEAVLELTLEAARGMVARGKRGVIMNISSASDMMVFPGFAVYAASKAFVTMVSQSLDAELKSSGVRVLASCPGVIRTNFRKRASGAADAPETLFTMSVEFAAKQIWKQIANRKKVHYFGWATRVLLFISRNLLPQALVSKILLKQIHQLKS